MLKKYDCNFSFLFLRQQQQQQPQTFKNKTVNDGCQDCECNSIGSLSMQCDLDTGLCSCAQNATSAKCDICVDGLWGLPDTNCQGSLNITCF